MPSVAMLCLAMTNVLRDILSSKKEGSREISCTSEHVLISPHALLNFVCMAEKDPRVLEKFRTSLTKDLKESGS